MKKRIKVTYTYTIKYEHKDHLEKFKKDLIKQPIYGVFGGGVASDDNVYSYSCKLTGKGVIQK